jgi:hypothetical protein
MIKRPTKKELSVCYMASTVQITLWLTVLATLLALVAVILVAVSIAQNRAAATGTTGTTGVLLLDDDSVRRIAAAAGGPNTQHAYGDGSAGDALFEGQTGLVLAADAQYRNLTLNGSTLDTNGYRLFCSGALTLTGASVIQCRGGPGANNNTVSESGASWVDGGWGAAAGTVGGGGDGGYGLLETGLPADWLNGAPSTHAFWGNDTTLFAGGNAATSSYATDDQMGGLGGAVLGDRTRAFYEVTQVLNPITKPTVPLLSGGSGGGGGHGYGSYPGSGGGGGGGVVVIAAQQLIVSQTSGATIDVSGGNAGAMFADCCDTGTSGGGGGGGLVVVATESNPASYAGLTINVSGGAGLDVNGGTVVAAPGRAVFWFNGAPSASNSNPNAFLRASSNQTQDLPKDVATTLLVHTVDSSLSMAFDPATGMITALSGGIYILTANVSVTPAVALTGWFRQNQDDDIKHGATRVSQAEDGVQYLSLFTTLQLEAGDSVDVQLLQTSGAEVTLGPSRFHATMSVALFGSS